MAEKEGFEPTEPLGSDALQAPAFDHSATSPRNGRYYTTVFQVCQTGKTSFLAERVGFEPTGQQAAQLISSQSPSTARAPLRDSIIIQDLFRLSSTKSVIATYRRYRDKFYMHTATEKYNLVNSDKINSQSLQFFNLNSDTYQRRRTI